MTVHVALHSIMGNSLRHGDSDIDVCACVRVCVPQNSELSDDNNLLF